MFSIVLMQRRDSYGKNVLTIECVLYSSLSTFVYSSLSFFFCLCFYFCYSKVKNGQLLSTNIELEAQPCAMAITGKNIIAGDMRHVLHSFGLKGKKNYSLHLPAGV